MVCRFLLEILEASEDRWIGQVSESPAGQFGPELLPLEDILQSQCGCKEVESSVYAGRRLEPARLEAIGECLFEAIMKGSIKTGYNRSKEIAHQAGQVLRIVLRLPHSLQPLCWEVLYDKDTPRGRRFLSMSDRTTVSRYPELSVREPTPPSLETLRVLALAATPEAYESLDVEREEYAIRAALNARPRAELSVLPHASWEDLRNRIRVYRPHIIHFMGHGVCSDHESVIFLEDHQGWEIPVSAEQLGELLVGSPVALVILNACETARASTDRISLAGVLAEYDIPGVIGMRFPISDSAAILFTDALYTYLLDGNGRPIDQALADARRAVKTRDVYEVLNDLEWTTPVLHMRSQDGMLFSLTEVSNEVELWMSIKELIRILSRVTSPKSVEETCRRLFQRGERAIALLAAAVGGHPQARVRERAARALGMIQDELSVRPLEKALQDPASAVRMRSAESLGWVGNANVIPSLEALCRSDPIPEVRTAAEQAIRALRRRQSGLAAEARANIREVQQRLRELTRQLHDMLADVRRAKSLANDLSDLVSSEQPIPQPSWVVSEKKDELNTLLGRVQDREFRHALLGVLDRLITLFAPTDQWKRELQELVVTVRALDDQVIETSDGHRLTLEVEEPGME